MLFNSFAFLIFFPIVVLIYFLINHKYRSLFLLLSSYYFYMNWKPAYAILIFSSTIITWFCAILIEKTEIKKRKFFLLTFSLIINFGILFLYKYFNFFNESVYAVLDLLNIRWEVPNLDLLLPVGISFYTFQAVGYTVDVFRGDLKTERNFKIYALFVSFFPQLVAGPIERAKNLLPQFRKKHYFDSSRLVIGLKQMIWGYFMKVVIADRLALYVNATFNNVDAHNGTSLLIGTVFFAFQIYCDFAGYSNIAIGASRIMGFDLMKNFNRPYFALNISEFWHRWHISLSTWFRDYVYIPLGGNRVSKSRNYLNLFITFALSGIWHGASWTFFIWGSIHGFYLIIQKFLKFDKIECDSIFIKKIGLIMFNFIIVLVAWIFFRANSLSDAFKVLEKIALDPGLPFTESATTLLYGLFGLSILIIKEIMDELSPNRYNSFENSNSLISAFKMAVLIVIILSIGVFDGSQFIYFQF